MRDTKEEDFRAIVKRVDLVAVIDAVSLLNRLAANGWRLECVDERTLHEASRIIENLSATGRSILEQAFSKPAEKSPCQQAVPNTVH